ncbi:MAG: hypothetical protein MZV64_09565 [Ignavibacteriales bacterium]|nr:hypothetical protein [Ignavibacteriales bacterium]
MGLVDEILHFVCANSGTPWPPTPSSGPWPRWRRPWARPRPTPSSGLHQGIPAPGTCTGARRTRAPGSPGRPKGYPTRSWPWKSSSSSSWPTTTPPSNPSRNSSTTTALRGATKYLPALECLETFFDSLPVFGPEKRTLVKLLRCPVEASPYSLPGQLDYMRRNWGLSSAPLLARILGGLDMIKEEEKPFFPGPGPSRVYVYEGMEHEYERFTEDKDWMPRVVMMAKSVLRLARPALGKPTAGRSARLDADPRRGARPAWPPGLQRASG